MAKLKVTEVAKQVALEGMQMMGGYGYATEYDMEGHVRATLVSTIYGGTNEIQREIIGKTSAFNGAGPRARACSRRGRPAVALRQHDPCRHAFSHPDRKARARPPVEPGARDRPPAEALAQLQLERNPRSGVRGQHQCLQPSGATRSP